MMEFLLLFWKAFGTLSSSDNYLWTRGPATAGHCRRPLQGFPKRPLGGDRRLDSLGHCLQRRYAYNGSKRSESNLWLMAAALASWMNNVPRRAPFFIFFLFLSLFPFFFLSLFLFLSSAFPSADNSAPRCPSRRAEQRDSQQTSASRRRSSGRARASQPELC